MRVRVSSVILSLVVATLVIAAPAPHAARLEKRDEAEDKISDLLTKALESLGCDDCLAALVGVKEYAISDKSRVLEIVNNLCPTLSMYPTDVCTGVVYMQGPVLLDSIIAADLTSDDGRKLCFQAAGACPAPDIGDTTVIFPKPRPADPVAPPPSGTQVEVLHFSDWHVDEEYVPGTDAICNRPMCCRKYDDSPSNITRAAASWGDYSCDAPVKLGLDLLSYIPSVAKPSFSIMTGDVPPHDVWLEDRSAVLPIERHAYANMDNLGINIYPTVGNHESGPTNLYPTEASGGDLSWLYSSLADNWSRWLPSDAVDWVKNYGAYAASPQKGLRIISLNTNFCYRMNFYLYADVDDHDPNGMIKWFINQLQAAEDAGERVWIIAHFNPSQINCLQNWSAQYYEIVQRYSPHVIAEQFFGHTHYDELSIYYQPGIKDAQNAISTAWTGPSVTPHSNLNPGFRIYQVDTGNWNVYDSLTYIADLSQATTWDATGATPNWHLEYSARQAYGSYVPIADDAPLSASWWHDVTVAFESDSAAFQQYWTYRGKSANRIGACAANTTCPAQTICNMRAGMSSELCSKITFSLTKE